MNEMEVIFYLEYKQFYKKINFLSQTLGFFEEMEKLFPKKWENI